MFRVVLAQVVVAVDLVQLVVMLQVILAEVAVVELQYLLTGLQ